MAEQAAFNESISKLPLVANISRLSPLLSPEYAADIEEIRTAAAPMKADMIALYTVDTEAKVHDYDVGPLNILALGFIPNQEARATATASLLLVDVRTGYIYGSSEASASHKKTSNVWLSRQAQNESIEQAETEAYEKLIEEFADLWCGVANEHLGTR
ncbi:hypothetical protein JD969_05180 [Planctomycetota bacterium]|nr:hypothetical protein JD969_05180 [Planctomycetota bacterium]